MTLQQWLRRRGSLALTILTGVSLLGSFSQADDIRLGMMKANRILFFGNSITYAPPMPQYGWTGNWGAAASSPEKDYVHLLTNSIAKAAGGIPATMATYNIQFEQNYATYDLGCQEMQSQLAFKPDIVVVAIGENVPSLATRQSQDEYALAFRNLLALFRDNGNPAIFVRSCFWADPTKDAIMKQATLTTGGVFVDQSALDVPSNRASNEVGNPFQNIGNGVNAHPGDKGMKAIADSLYHDMRAYAVPEPGSMHTLAVGVLGLLSCAVWKRKALMKVDR